MSASASTAVFLKSFPDHTCGTFRDRRMAPSGRLQAVPKPKPVHLTPRELEVLALLFEGLPNKLICRRLGISAGTVKVHMTNIMRTLDVSSRLQAVISAQRMGLLLDGQGASTHALTQCCTEEARR